MNSSFILNHIKNQCILNEEVISGLHKRFEIYDNLAEGFFPRYILPVPPQRDGFEEEEDCKITN